MTLWGDPWTLFLFIPPFHSPLPRFSVFGVIPIICPFDTLGGRFCFSGVGEGKKLQAGLKDGPSRHPEKVYPGGEGHERRGRGARGGQLRQRLYGESDSRRRPYLAPGAPAASLLPPFIIFTPFPPSHWPPCSKPPPFPVSCFRVFPRRWVRGGHTALFLFLPFPGFTWRPSIVSHSAESTTGDCSF